MGQTYMQKTVEDSQAQHARDIEAGPVARVRIPRRVPIGFHANWLAEC